jgi:hypothetical protein
VNPLYFGDSYDLVKRFFCAELRTLGYSVVVDAMLTGDWASTESYFYQLIGASPHVGYKPDGGPTALLLDPDTGIKQSASRQHVSYARIAHETSVYNLVFSFDQSFSRQTKASDVIREKLAALKALGCTAMYYDSHARFVFAAAEAGPIYDLRNHLVSLGIPRSRLIEAET